VIRIGEYSRSRVLVSAVAKVAYELDEMKEAAERRWVWVGDVRTSSEDMRWAQIIEDEDVHMDESELEVEL